MKQDTPDVVVFGRGEPGDSWLVSVFLYLDLVHTLRSVDPVAKEGGSRIGGGHRGPVEEVWMVLPCQLSKSLHSMRTRGAAVGRLLGQEIQ